MKILIGALFLCLYPAQGLGESILLVSGSGIGTNNITGTNVTMTDPASVWATDPNCPETCAQWISFMDTGVKGAFLPNSFSTPVAVFYQTFASANPSNNAFDGSVSVWADDTAAVYLNGVLLAAPSFTLGVNCTIGGIGCLRTASETLTFSGATGPNQVQTLEFDVYQLGGYTTGLMYDGTVNFFDPPAAPVPEPDSLILFATAATCAIAGVKLLNRRAHRR